MFQCLLFSFASQSLVNILHHTPKQKKLNYSTQYKHQTSGKPSSLKHFTSKSDRKGEQEKTCSQSKAKSGGGYAKPEEPIRVPENSLHCFGIYMYRRDLLIKLFLPC